jgi:hypothetical protein
MLGVRNSKRYSSRKLHALLRRARFVLFLAGQSSRRYVYVYRNKSERGDVFRLPLLPPIGVSPSRLARFLHLKNDPAMA